MRTLVRPSQRGGCTSDRNPYGRRQPKGFLRALAHRARSRCDVPKSACPHFGFTRADQMKSGDLFTQQHHCRFQITFSRVAAIW
jgi:hypothetical protein